MAAPSQTQALEALRRVQSMSGGEVDRAITAAIGEPMLGVLHSLAAAMMPDLPHAERLKLVHLMVLTYLMRDGIGA